MSLKTIFRQGSITNKRFKNLGKTIGIGLFTLLMLTNIKFALMDDAELASGDISLFGIEMQLFEGTYGETASAYCDGDCIGGCAAYGMEAYCSSYDCACSCIYLDAYGQWYWSTAGGCY